MHLEWVDSSVGTAACHRASDHGVANYLRKAMSLYRRFWLRQAALVQALLESGADPNLQNLRGDNPAHVAASRGHLKVNKCKNVSISEDSPAPLVCCGAG